ncbi:MAG: RidA family protein [Firmicutes bacterium]|nr:RidA family protein [Bacillota bacterium]
MKINTIQPPDLPVSPAFSQALEVIAPSKLLFIGGQNALDKHGNLVGPGDFAAQVKQALANIKSILDHAGYDIAHVVDMTIFYTNGNDGRVGYQVFVDVFGTPDVPPTVSAIQVENMGIPERLVEIKAIAVK